MTRFPSLSGEEWLSNLEQQSKVKAIIRGGTWPHGIEAKYYYYRIWACVHLERKSLVGRDFVRYLAVKERYFGTPEDEAYLRAAAAPVGPTIPGTNVARRYTADITGYDAMDDPWNYGQ